MEKLYVLSRGGLNLNQLAGMLDAAGKSAVHRVDLPSLGVENPPEPSITNQAVDVIRSLPALYPGGIDDLLYEDINGFHWN